MSIEERFEATCPRWREDGCGSEVVDADDALAFVLGMNAQSDELLVVLKSLVVESEFNELLFADQRPAGWKPRIIELARALIARIEKP